MTFVVNTRDSLFNTLIKPEPHYWPSKYVYIPSVARLCSSAHLLEGHNVDPDSTIGLRKQLDRLEIGTHLRKEQGITWAF